MNHIKYKQRICSDEQKINDFLLKSRVAVVAMISNNLPYSVPVNFVFHNNAIYFHGMGSGRKVECLNTQPDVNLNIYTEYGTVKDNVPCKVDTSYFSVMIFGQVKKVVDFEESAEVLQKMLDKYMPSFFSQKLSSNMVEKYRSSHDNKGVAVYKIETKCITAKENVALEGDIF